MGREDPIKVRERARKWRLDNPERARTNNKNWAAKNWDKVIQHKKDWVARNPEKAKESARATRVRYWGKIRERVREKYHTDPATRIASAQRVRLRRALRGALKSDRTFSLVGCSPDRLVQYLQAQFREGMSWENYGRVWQVDHKKPCAKFDLTQPSEQQKCFHFTNLQPLFSAENFRKGAR